ncbi:hypothetical protein ABIA43_004724 [Bradyrhizobium sp. USDA 328]
MWAPALQRTAEEALRCVRGTSLPYNAPAPNVLQAWTVPCW